MISAVEQGRADRAVSMFHPNFLLKVCTPSEGAHLAQGNDLGTIQFQHCNSFRPSEVACYAIVWHGGSVMTSQSTGGLTL